MGDKGRFVLPPEIRNKLKLASDGRQLCLAKDAEFDCLIGFGLEREETLAEQLDREEERAIRLGLDFNRTIRSSQLYGFKTIPFDESGRFTMPDHLQSLGRIEDTVYFQGAGDTFQLWNPAVLEQQGNAWESARAACQDLLTKAQAKLKAKRK